MSYIFLSSSPYLPTLAQATKAGNPTTATATAAAADLQAIWAVKNHPVSYINVFILKLE